MSQWITKLKGLTEAQVAIIPDDVIIERGSDYVLFEGSPHDIYMSLSRKLESGAPKTAVLKYLSKAKDADTPNVYTEPVRKPR